MSQADDARFWDRASRRYAMSAVAEPAGHERTLDQTRVLLKTSDSVPEQGCGMGTTALRLATSAHSYLATDISEAMIAIATEKQAAAPVPPLIFRATTVEALVPGREPFDAILGFNYLHLVRDLSGTLRGIHMLLAAQGLFVSRTPCVGDMNPLIRFALPAMRAIGQAPYASVFRADELRESLHATGFEILAAGNHATKGDDCRPYVIARKK